MTPTDEPGRPDADGAELALVNPKYAHNVGAALRAASCFGATRIWWTGRRVTLDVAAGQRLPREERMKGYRDVAMVRDDRFFDRLDPGVVPVAVELRPGAECLLDFEHPARACYVFGPEDGSIPRPALACCHRFVILPTRHCVNLAAAAYLVLYDRLAKRVAAGLQEAPPPGGWLAEPRGPADGAELFAGVSDAGLGAAHRRRG